MARVSKNPIVAGAIYGRLTALSECGVDGGRNRLWRFLCCCGEGRVIRAITVSSGETQSCGCLRKGGVKANHRYPTLRHALEARISPGSGTCLEWQGAVGTHGYGVFTYAYTSYLAHRAAWELYVGPIPDGKDVLHRCDNPRCCNVDHLFLGGDRENVDDKVAKRRHNFGEKVPQAKLTADQAREIKAITNTTQAEIAKRYGVSTSTVSDIKRGTAWKLALE